MRTASSSDASIRRRSPPVVPRNDRRVTRRADGEGTWPSSRCCNETDPCMRPACPNRRRPASGWGARHPTRYARDVAARDEITSFLNELLDIEAYPDGLPVGMQVPGAHEVTRVATGVSASLELFTRAAQERAQMLIVHHGLFYGSGVRP